MKPKALPVLGLFIVLLALCAAVPSSARVAAQGGPPQTPTLSPQDILDQAHQISSDAENASSSAVNIVANADNAVSTANLLLRIALGATAIGGLLVAAIAFLGIRTLVNGIREARKELAKARVDLADMRAGLKHDTELVHEQSNRAVRALALMQLGEQQLDRRNIKGALRTYSRAYELDPNNRATNYFLGELYVQDNQLEKGIEHLRRDLDAGVTYAPAQAALGLALRLQADQQSDEIQREVLYLQAEEQLLKALQIDSAVLDIYGESVHAVLGGLYKRKGRLDRAIYRYEEARKITPNKSYPVMNLALLSSIQGDYGRAMPLFERAESMSSYTLNLNPLDYWARLDRMTARLVLGKTADAMDDLDFVTQQVNLVNPLETAAEDLIRLRNAPTPPPGLDAAIEKLQAATARLEATAERPQLNAQ